MIHITEDIVLNENDIKERFVRAGGPNGKHVPRHASAVELSLDLGKLALSDAMAQRLMAVARKHITNDGTLIVVARADRSQHVNREAARRHLLKLLGQAAAVTKARRSTRPRQPVRAVRKDEKQLHADVKRARRDADGDR
jgi:ribosome-associated protein